jgi:hypothetical protein
MRSACYFLSWSYVVVVGVVIASPSRTRLRCSKKPAACDTCHMTVHRSGSKLSYSGESGRSLGRLLVTIDDLRALQNYVTDHAVDKNSVTMEFNGGTFDDVEDIRTLTEKELAIAIKSDSIYVKLPGDRAQVCGRRAACESLYSDWARPRHGLQGQRINLLYLWSVQIVFFLVTGGMAYFLVKEAYDFGLFTIDTLLNLTFFALAAGLCVLTRDLRGKDSVVIKPITLDELRREYAVSNRHWQTAFIAVMSLLVAMSGVLVAVLTKR